ncbi:MAG: lysophospholipid acyltransferase family protein [Rickettsiales endosymbiont of Dermacentor nuttalli]
MKILKKILQSKLIRFLCAKLIYCYVKLVYFTGKWVVHKPRDIDIDGYLTEPCIYAFWHGRLTMMPLLAPKGRKMNVLSSRHRDGYLMSASMKNFGFSTIFGSSKKGGAYALRNIVRSIRVGENIAITPDGPRGPRYTINSNIIYIAKITNTPIIPISFASSKHRVFNSWDRFMFPYLFSRGILIYGKPIVVSKDISEQEEENLKQELQLELNQITNNSDLMVKEQSN